MESSAEEKRGEGAYDYMYSPCYFFKQIIKALSKCLGKEYDHHHHQQQQAATETASASGTETEMKITEEEFAMEATTTRALKITKRPPRPPVSSGSGGQIH